MQGNARMLTGTDQIPRHAVPEVVKHPVPVRLQHFRVRVEARVAELGDFLGQQLDAVGRVAKDDGLVDLELLTSALALLVQCKAAAQHARCARP